MSEAVSKSKAKRIKTVVEGEVTHEDNLNCMCVTCHTLWESLIKAGDSVTINRYVDAINEANK